MCSAILLAMAGTFSFLHSSWVAFLLLWQETRGLHTGRGGQRRYWHMKQPGEGLSRPELWLTASRWSRPLPLNPGWAQDVGRRCPTLSNTVQPHTSPLPRSSHSSCQAPGNESKYANQIISTLHVRGSTSAPTCFTSRYEDISHIPAYHNMTDFRQKQESIKTLC